MSRLSPVGPGLRRGAALLAIFSLATAADDPLATLTSEQARAMSPPALARAVLGLAGSVMHDSRVFTSGPPFNSPDQLSAVQFARTAEASGSGVCEAKTVSVLFAPADPGHRDPDPPSRSVGLISGSLWAALPGATDLPADPVARAQAENAHCAALTPILTPGAGFFSADQGLRELNAWEVSAIIGLLRTLDTPPPSLRSKVSCGDDQVAGCPDALDALTRIDMLRPNRVSVDQCRPGAPRLCLKLEYDRVGLESVAGSYTEVRVDIGAATLTDPSRPARFCYSE